MAASASKQFGKAIELIEKAISFDGDRAEYHAHLGRCLAVLKRDREARAAAERAVELGPTDSLTLDTIGVVLSRLGAHEKAVDVFKEAAARAQQDSNVQFNLAASLKFLGRFDEAEEAYETAVTLRPEFLRAHWALSELVTATPEHNHIERLERLLDSKKWDVNEALYLCHALAKEYEDLGEYQKAFEYLELGKLPKVSSLDYSIADDRDVFDAITHVCSAEYCASAAPGHESDEPIFIVGMPRTGTTLVERILASHDDVFAAGELSDFGLRLKKAANTSSQKMLDVETIHRAAGLDFAALGEAYVEGTRPRTGQTKHFIDKLPSNFLYAGFIHRALPNARIICLRRNPMDTCLSNYRQLFSLNAPYYNYAYDLIDTGHYYLMFHALVEHWQQALSNNFVVVRYEDVVDDIEREARKLLEFCGVSWDPKVLKFHESGAPVATASAVQVRNPIYESSVQRWKQYEKQLAPLRDLFSSRGLDYE